jgi:hypothetical protein
LQELAPKAPKVSLDLRELKVFRVVKELKVLLDLKALKVLQELELKVFKELQVQLVEHSVNSYLIMQVPQQELRDYHIQLHLEL